MVVCYRQKDQRVDDCNRKKRELVGSGEEGERMRRTDCCSGECIELYEVRGILISFLSVF